MTSPIMSGKLPAESVYTMPAGTVPQMPVGMVFELSTEGTLTAVIGWGESVFPASSASVFFDPHIVLVDSRAPEILPEVTFDVILGEAKYVTVDFSSEAESRMDNYVDGSEIVEELDLTSSGNVTFEVMEQEYCYPAIGANVTLDVDVTPLYEVAVDFTSEATLALQYIEVEAVAVGVTSVATFSVETMVVYPMVVNFGTDVTLATNEIAQTIKRQRMNKDMAGQTTFYYGSTYGIIKDWLPDSTDTAVITADKMVVAGAGTVTITAHVVNNGSQWCNYAVYVDNVLVVENQWKGKVTQDITWTGPVLDGSLVELRGKGDAANPSTGTYVDVNPG